MAEETEQDAKSEQKLVITIHAWMLDGGSEDELYTRNFGSHQSSFIITLEISLKQDNVILIGRGAALKT